MLLDKLKLKKIKEDKSLKYIYKKKKKKKNRKKN